jgi:hypothetical protein
MDYCYISPGQRQLGYKPVVDMDGEPIGTARSIRGASFSVILACGGRDHCPSTMAELEAHIKDEGNVFRC